MSGRSRFQNGPIADPNDISDCNKQNKKNVTKNIKGRFTIDEDIQIMKMFNDHRPWKEIANYLERTSRSVKEHYKNCLDQRFNHEPFTPEEDDLLIKCQREHGNDWKYIADNFFKDRTRTQVRDRSRTLSERSNPSQVIDTNLPHDSSFIEEIDESEKKDIFEIPLDDDFDFSNFFLKIFNKLFYFD